ncbi:F-box only protein 43-like [Coregonus clupeaformis]|uniref:F-box only protein 43-like n=1 Tax=Coregonus clupeaformis TaxID=59861 RepID=UPI001BE09319|nr:F-box only protein 43-like [Coregonus clupeaformis]XP_041758244.1 F-box only protein 43-like [Coregonus clupeaformis]XP_041758245.1 F-box only protein 43-like [Coregonus clupeaformis]
MECSLRPDAHFQSRKDLQYGACHDSGYLDSGYSPKMESGDTFALSKCFSSDGFHEMPKENLSQKCEPLSPRKNRLKEGVRSPQKDILKEQPLQNGWCETPKVSKRGPSLRRRLLMSKSEGKTAGNTKTPCAKKTDSSVNVRTDRCSNVVCDSPDAFTIGALATSTLKPEDVLLSSRKRRLLFSLVKTSTLEDGKCNTTSLPLFERKASAASLSDADLEESIISSDRLSTEMLETPRYSRLTSSVKENFQTPVNNNVAANLSDSLSVLSTPSSTPTHKHDHDTPSSTPTHKHYDHDTPSSTPTLKHCDRSVSEDSGFSSLALDKSQDSTVDNDGSFQELLLSSGSSRCKETPSRLAEMKRRSRLERQRRLSTLREGGSQSEGDRDVRALVAHRTHHREKNLTSQAHLERSIFKEDDSDVFLDVTPPKTATVKLEDLSFTPALQMVQALAQKTSGMLLEQTSLEELLRASEKEAFRTTMPLAGLIGRKMGLGKVDIFTELKKKNLRHILAMILNQLSSEDVYRVGQVSDSWNEIVVQNKMSDRRRRHYLMDVKAALELGSAVHVPDAETRLTLLSRSALKSVQAQSRTPSSSTRGTPQSATGTGSLTPVQHNSASKQDMFIQVAKTLFSDECLKPCPRCRHPARCHSVKMEGVCSRVDCGFQFCTGCLCAFHGSKECASVSAMRRSKKDVLPGSAQSKRNVRRL